jgi:hypothetical protein
MLELDMDARRLHAREYAERLRRDAYEPASGRDVRRPRSHARRLRLRSARRLAAALRPS